jgi:hypothetical protein
MSDAVFLAYHVGVFPGTVVREAIKPWGVPKGDQHQDNLAADTRDMALRVDITECTCTDCTQAGILIGAIKAEHLLADRGYDKQAQAANNAGADTTFSLGFADLIQFTVISNDLIGRRRGEFN